MTNKRRRLFGRIKLPVRGRIKRRHEHQKYYITIMTFSYAPVKWDTDKYWRCFCGYQKEIRLAIHTIIGLSYIHVVYRKRTVRRNILHVRSNNSCKTHISITLSNDGLKIYFRILNCYNTRVRDFTLYINSILTIQLFRMALIDLPLKHPI